MTADRPRRLAQQAKIHEKYRRLLRRPGLTVEQVEEMRKHVIRLAQTICEHVWGKTVY